MMELLQIAAAIGVIYQLYRISHQLGVLTTSVKYITQGHADHEIRIRELESKNESSRNL